MTCKKIVLIKLLPSFVDIQLRLQRYSSRTSGHPCLHWPNPEKPKYSKSATHPR